MQKHSAILAIAFTLGFNISNAAGVEQILACPGQTLTLSQLVGKVTASTRTCMKMVNSSDGTLATVEFWKIGLVGQIEKLGTKSGSACFDYSVALLGRQELRAGGFERSTTIYKVEIDTTKGLNSPFDDHDYLLNSIKLPTAEVYANAVDACRPACERTPPPSKPDKTVPIKDRCVWHCGPTGNWARSCPFASTKKGGQPQ